MALSPAEPLLCHYLEEVPSSVPPFQSLDGMGDVSRRSPDVPWSWFHSMASVCCHVSPPLSTVGPV